MAGRIGNAVVAAPKTLWLICFANFAAQER